jgi:hypothetical protein
MSSAAVRRAEQLYATLASSGFEKTGHKTGTGTFWRNASKKVHLLIPDVDKLPVVMFEDLIDRIEQLKG